MCLHVLLDFYVDNFIMLTLLIGMYIMTLFDVYLDKRTLYLLRCTEFLILAASVFSRIEAYFGTLDHPTLWRQLLSALCYTINPVILMMMVFIANKKARWFTTVPAALNAVVAFSVFFSRIAYFFTEDNTFDRGPLGYMPYVTSVFYILLLFLVSFRVLARRSQQEGVVVLFLAVTGAVCSVLSYYEHDNLVFPAFTAELLLYYLFIYSQLTRRDALTGLRNRQSFYSELHKFPGTVTGIVSIDMNELKWMNDTLGHEAGDRALRAIAEVFLRADAAGDPVYRTGGDEFIMICRGRSNGEMQKTVETLRRGVTEAGYSCAFGLAAGKGIDEMMKEADRLMYEDKARLKAEAARTGKPLHMRS